MIAEQLASLGEKLGVPVPVLRAAAFRAGSARA